MSPAPVTVASVAVSALGEAAFIAALFLGSLLLPGRKELGIARGDDDPIAYRMNGLALFASSLAAAAIAEAFGPGLAPLARYVWSLLIAANVLAFAISVALFRAGRRHQAGPASDFFFGVEHDPSLFGVDLKLFSYRPSLIGLALINLACASQQYRLTGHVTLSIVLYEAFTLIYVANYFQFEYGMVHTFDIIEERFGWMLVWGDYALVPFFYSLPAFYVAGRMQSLGWSSALAVVLIYGFGFWMFRGANGQKHRFKCNPGTRIWGRPARALGGKLLVSGFWGIGRKLNYTGELLMYVTWCSLAGGRSAVPYALPAFLAVLLIHRAARDDRRCSAKYGVLWQEYCADVPFRMFPLVESLGRLMLGKRSEAA